MENYIHFYPNDLSIALNNNISIQFSPRFLRVSVSPWLESYFLTVSHVTIFCPFSVFQKATMEAAFTTQK